MQKGNISTPLNLVANKMDHGIVRLDKKTISQFVFKHTQKSCLSEDVLINGPIEKVLEIV